MTVTPSTAQADQAMWEVPVPDALALTASSAVGLQLIAVWARSDSTPGAPVTLSFEPGTPLRVRARYEQLMELAAAAEVAAQLSVKDEPPLVALIAPGGTLVVQIRPSNWTIAVSPQDEALQVLLAAIDEATAEGTDWYLQRLENNGAPRAMACTDGKLMGQDPSLPINGTLGEFLLTFLVSQADSPDGTPAEAEQDGTSAARKEG